MIYRTFYAQPNKNHGGQLLVRRFLCLFASEHHVCQRLGRLRLCLVDGVRVNVQRRGNIGMTEPVCNCDHIHAVSDQHGGVRVPESVRVQVREVMPLCELAQPACEAVRVYRCTVVLHKQKAAVLPAVAVLEPEFIVPRPIFPQKLHGLFRERKKRRVLRFRRTFINAELREIEKRGVNADDMILKVDFLPLETADVLPASSRNQEQMQHRFPLDGLLLCCVQNGGDGVRLVKIRLAFPDLWR